MTDKWELRDQLRDAKREHWNVVRRAVGAAHLRGFPFGMAFHTATHDAIYDTAWPHVLLADIEATVSPDPVACFPWLAPVVASFCDLLSGDTDTSCETADEFGNALAVVRDAIAKHKAALDALPVALSPDANPLVRVVLRGARRTWGPMRLGRGEVVRLTDKQALLRVGVRGAATPYEFRVKRVRPFDMAWKCPAAVDVGTISVDDDDMLAAMLYLESRKGDRR